MGVNAGGWDGGRPNIRNDSHEDKDGGGFNRHLIFELSATEFHLPKTVVYS